MPKYRVFFAAVAEYSVEVEAEDGDQAVEQAFDKARFPYFGAGQTGDLGQWGTLSDLFPDINTPEDDYTLIED